MFWVTVDNRFHFWGSCRQKLHTLTFITVIFKVKWRIIYLAPNLYLKLLLWSGDRPLARNQTPHKPIMQPIAWLFGFNIWGKKCEDQVWQNETPNAQEKAVAGRTARTGEDTQRSGPSFWENKRLSFIPIPFWSNDRPKKHVVALRLLFSRRHHRMWKHSVNRHCDPN